MENDNDLSINELIKRTIEAHKELAQDNGWTFNEPTEQHLNAIKTDVKSEIYERLYKVCISP